MLNSSVIKKATFVLLSAFFLISCDKDFNEIGTGLVGEDHFEFTGDSLSTITAYTRKTGAVETSNLFTNPLGVFDNGRFGKTTANFVTQVSLATADPTFRNVTLARIESVVLYVPYFSTLESTNSEGTNTYKLDSIYGAVNQEFKLSVYENGYYLRSFDPSNNFERQKFYSDQDAMFDAVKLGAGSDNSPVVNGAPLNNGTSTQNVSFKFSATEVDMGNGDDGETVYAAPGMRLDLNKEYFLKRIFQNAGDNLVNNNAFQNYFRGLYFKVEEGTSPGALAMLNFAGGAITIKYKEDVTTTVNGVEVVSESAVKTLAINLTGNTVSLLKNESTGNSADYDAAIGNATTGDARIFLKGGEGAVTFIDLFGGGNSTELDELRNTAIANNWLVNEAHIVFNVDEPTMENTIDPNRIYLYDATNRRPIIDYTFDATSNNSLPKYGKVRLDGIAQLTGASGSSNRKVKKYRIRITDHIKNVIFNDSTNVRLGLSVTETIANSGNLARKTPSAEFRSVPFASVLSPLGTVIYGSNLPASDTKKLRLVISFTKPD